MATPGLAALSVFGSTVQAYGQIKASKTQAANLKHQAFLEGINNEEILNRASLNEMFTKQDFQRELGNTMSSFAENGVDITSGASLMVMSELLSSMNETVAINNREAQFDVIMGEEKMQSLQRASHDAITNGKLQAFGTVLGGAAAAGAMSR